VLDSDIYDGPIKTQIALDVLVTEKDFDPAELRALLMHLYKAARSRTGFKYRTNPNAAYVYIYPTREHFASGMGQWIGMVAKAASDEAPQYTIREDRFPQNLPQDDVRFGKAESERRAIFAELVRAEDRAQREADRAYPPQRMKNRNNVKDYAELLQRLTKEYTDEVLRKHNLSEEQAQAISVEGITENWPMPEWDEDG